MIKSFIPSSVGEFSDSGMVVSVGNDAVAAVGNERREPSEAQNSGYCGRGSRVDPRRLRSHVLRITTLD
jgi:hypothetical protein